MNKFPPISVRLRVARSSFRPIDSSTLSNPSLQFQNKRTTIVTTPSILTNRNTSVTRMAAADGSKPADGTSDDVERPAVTGGETAVSSVVHRWRQEELQEKGSLVLRAAACLFSLISFVVMASNKHGDWKDFDKYEEYRYCTAIGVLAFLYTMAQILRQAHRFSTGRDLVPRSAASIVDFTGDQVIAYLLISASSAAIPITNRMREGADNMFTDASSASISMAFFAFAALALSSLISGLKLSKQTYI